MTSDILIRKCERADSPALAKVAFETFDESFAAMNNPEDIQTYMALAFSERTLSIELENPESAYYFAIKGEEVLGYLKLNWGDAQTENVGLDALEIQRIYVRNTSQRLGVGNVLMNKAKEVAHEKGLAYIWLGVWEKNQKALNFYKKNGFEVFGSHIFVLGSDEQTDLMMKLML
jgi:diamine N-acetyltransferase